jgi:transcriptional regulator with XRE-family HTH domain
MDRMEGRRRGDHILVAFGQAIRDHRRSRGWSQEHLAELAGLHRNYVQSLEHGNRSVSLLSVFALADALGLPACDLVEVARPSRADP